MNLVARFRRVFGPRTIQDPEFGELVYMHIRVAPERSYWECEWLFPVTDTRVSISLPGNSDGPTEDARRFYRELPGQFPDHLGRARPEIERAFQRWIGRPVSGDLWKDLRLSGFGVEDPSQTPTPWDMMFETTGDKWLAITIPFVGDRPQEAVVDT